MLITRFAHFFGMCLWLGAMVAAMVLAITARSETAPSRVFVFRLLAKVYSSVIGPSAVLTVVTGGMLTMSMAQRGATEAARLGTWVMEVTGLLAGVVVLFGSLPTATKLGRLADLSDQTSPPPAFERLRKRLIVMAHVAAALFVVSLFFGSAVR